MKITNRKLLDSFESLRILSNLKMPIKVSLTLAKNCRLIDEVLSDYKETLKKIQMRHAKRDENGDLIIENENYIFENMDEFNAEFQELLSLEVDIAVELISSNDIGNSEIEPLHLYNVLWLIDSD